MNFLIKGINKSKKGNAILRSWDGERGNQISSSKSLNEEFQKFQRIIDDFELENSILKEIIDSLKQDKNQAKTQKYFGTEFEKQISHMSSRIDNRSNNLISISKKISRKRERMFDVNSSTNEKTRLLEENTILAQKALSLEIKSMYERLRLHLVHDQRDFLRIKCQSKEVFDPSSDLFNECSEILINKLRIRNLKQYMNHEKEMVSYRIRMSNIEEKCAIIIQNSWRRYIARAKYIEMRKNIKHDTEGDPFPELEDSDSETKQ